MIEKTKTGHCLCGAVHVTAQLVDHTVGVCHCSMCLRWAGGPLMAIACTPETAFSGADCITVFPSSEWAERGFCSRCGSSLFYRLKGDGSYYLPVGLFEDHDGLTLATEIFIDRKPAFYSFAEETKTMTEAEVMAMYGAAGEGA